MDIIGIIEVFALVTGVPYIVLEVLQKNGMWYFGIATGLACAYSFAIQHVWSNMSLNNEVRLLLPSDCGASGASSKSFSRKSHAAGKTPVLSVHCCCIPE